MEDDKCAMCGGSFYVIDGKPKKLRVQKLEVDVCSPTCFEELFQECVIDTSVYDREI